VFNPRCPLPQGPILTQCVIRRHKCTCQMASKSVEWFKQGARMWQTTDRQTDERQTTLRRNVRCVAIGGIAYARAIPSRNWMICESQIIYHCSLHSFTIVVFFSLIFMTEYGRVWQNVENFRKSRNSKYRNNWTGRLRRSKIRGKLWQKGGELMVRWAWWDWELSG